MKYINNDKEIQVTDPFCVNCQQLHKYKTFEKVLNTVYWFCSEECKKDFRSETSTLSMREFKSTGGWE